MQKNLYFASPLRRDYITKPVRNFTPIIIEETSRTGTTRDPNLSVQKVARFQDGLLVNLLFVNGLQSGLFLFNNNTCLIYRVQGGRPHGINYLISTSGLILSANYQSGVLNRWLLAMYNDQFIICYNYKRGIKDGQQYFYNMQDKLLVISQYKKGKFQQIKNVIKGELQKIMKNHQILERIHELQSKQFSIDKKFPHLKLSGYEYYGELNDKYDVPHGYGILLGNKQIYTGNFINGFLNGIGCIKFEDNSIYYGDFQYGTCSGYGCISNGKMMVYKYEQENISKKQFDEYLSQVMIKDKLYRWSYKYQEYYQMLQEFNFKYLYNSKFIKQQISNQINVQRKSNLFQEHQHHQISHQIDDKKQNIKNQQVSKAKKIQYKDCMRIPKLQLLQNQKQQNGTIVKQNQDKKTKRRKISLVQKHTQIPIRKNQEKQKYLQIPSSCRDKIERDKSYKEVDKNGIITINSNEQHITAQLIKGDKQFVDWQETHLKPNEMQCKQKFNKNTQQKLQKKQGDTRINLGKIMRVGSEVSEQKQDEFIKKICS